LLIKGRGVMSTVLVELFTELGQLFRLYQYQAALAIIATLLVIFGNDINSSIKKILAKQHFIVRTSIFILICAFGYGLLTVWLTSLLAQQLANLPSLYLLPVVFIIFLTLGIYAQKQHHI
jgi:membrane protease YdiL (CAAX protease family)